jgi:hypothetical protein
VGRLLDDFVTKETNKLRPVKDFNDRKRNVTDITLPEVISYKVLV